LRETAIRIFAVELNSSTLETREAEEKSSVYIVTPLGARVNRVLITGVLTDVASGTNEELVRATVADPTGDVRISAGQYQEYGKKALSSITVPSYVAVVGKAKAYRPEDGAFYTYVRVEAIAAVDQQRRNYWLYETCRDTVSRINAMRAAMELSPPTQDALIRMGVPPRLATGAIEALQHYGRVEVDKYREAVIEALRTIGDVEELSQNIPTVTTEEEELSTSERLLLDIISETDKHNRGADYQEILARARARKLTDEETRTALDGLLEKGMIYEPSLGRMKRI